jgi:hypothetical protein
MAQMILDSFREFTGGVVTAGLAARQSRSTSPRGWNSVLTNIGQDSATPAKRPGCKTVNTTRISADAVYAQIEHLTYASGVATRYHIAILASGEIGYISSDPSTGDGSWTQIAASTFSTNDGKDVDYATAKNLLFLVDGAVAKKLRGTTLENFGIERPSSAPTLAAGAAGAMSGTFEVRVTYYNGNTGHESSASDTSNSVTLSSQQLDLSSVPVSADAQVTKRKIYIRNTQSQTSFRYAGEIADNSSTTATLNVNTATLVILAPTTTQNDPPPSGITACAWWQSYMVVADDDNIYWSQRDKPESFFADDYEPVGALDGQKITALVPFGDALLIFKTRSVYIVTGRSPASWQLRPLFTDIGNLSKRSMVNAGGAIYWWSHRGPVRWEGTDYPTPIAELLLTPSDFEFDTETSHLIYGAADETNQLVLWTFPVDEGTENTKILPFNYKLNAFVANKWDPMNVASLVAMQDNGGKRWVYFGNYNGQLFRFDDADADGVPSGTVTGTFTAAGTSTSSITGSGFYNTGTGLAKRIVTIEDANRQYIGRAEISSNTATDLTLGTSITGLTIGSVYTFHVGGPNFEWATPPEDSKQSFIQKRYKTIHIKTANGGGVIGVSFYTDNDADTAKRTLSFTDDDGEKSIISNRLVASAVALEWQVIVHNRAANVPVTLYDVAMLSELLTEKIG